jgi:hypothetical protein
MLTEISRQAKEALTDQGIDTPLFFIVPSGNAVITFGCSCDPSDDEGNRVADIFAPIVSRLIRLAGARCRAVACATTEIADQPHNRRFNRLLLDADARAQPCSRQQQRADEIS